MTCAQGLLRLLWGGPKLECYGTDYDVILNNKQRKLGELSAGSFTRNSVFLGQEMQI